MLKKHLELHVDDLHRWQKYLSSDPDAFAYFDADNAKLLASLDVKAGFADQVCVYVCVYGVYVYVYMCVKNECVDDEQC